MKQIGEDMAQTRIVIVGGGFGGLAAAKALSKTPAQVILIDRTNHHLFQPLLYQVATSLLAPSQIGSPIRGILRNQKNTTVILDEVTGVDKDKKCVFVNNVDRQDVPIEYDYLILATGVTHSYFGHDKVPESCTGVEEPRGCRRDPQTRSCRRSRRAEAEEDPSRHRDLLTFVLVGAGPATWRWEMAIDVLVRSTLKSEFRRIDPASTRIVLVDMAPRVLAAFSADPLDGRERSAQRSWASRSRLGRSVG